MVELEVLFAWFLYAMGLTPQLPPELLLWQPSIIAETPLPQLPDNHLILLLFPHLCLSSPLGTDVEPCCLAGDSPLLSAFSPPGSAGEPLRLAFMGHNSPRFTYNLDPLTRGPALSPLHQVRALHAISEWLVGAAWIEF